MPVIQWGPEVMMIPAGVVITQHEQVDVADSSEAVVQHRWILAAELSQRSCSGSLCP